MPVHGLWRSLRWVYTFHLERSANLGIIEHTNEVVVLEGGPPNLSGGQPIIYTSRTSFSGVSYRRGTFNLSKFSGSFPNIPLPGRTANTRGGESKASVIMEARMRASNARMGRVRTERAAAYSGEDVGTAESSTKYHVPPEARRILEGERAQDIEPEESDVM